MNIKPFHCETCKQEKSTVLVDGYAFGDRLFDGVMFVVENVNGKPICSGVVEEDKVYFDGENKKKWINECEDYCQDLDVASCPDCNDDIAVWHWLLEQPARQGKVIKGISGDEFLRKIGLK